MQSAARPLLSIGLIVKNEIRCLERCMKSLQPLRDAIPCEIVIADTGSDDGTWELAGQYADILFRFAWCNDFAAARNAVLDRCSGSWYMFIDADEWLITQPDQLIQFLRSPESKQYDQAHLCICNYNPDQEDGGEDHLFYAGRLARAATGARFHGAIHEIFQIPGKGTSASYLLDKITLNHDGYQPEVYQSKNKLERNMTLLRQELERDPKDIRLYLLCTTGTLDAVEKMNYIRQGALAARQPDAKNRQLAAPLYRYGVKLSQERGNTAEMEGWLARAEEEFPDSIFTFLDAQGYALQRYFSEGNYETAALHGLRWRAGVTRYDRNEYTRTELSYDSIQLISKWNRSNLPLLLIDSLCKLERWEEADQLLSEIDYSLVSDTNWGPLLGLLYAFGQKLHGAEVQLARLWDITCQRYDEGKPGWGERRTQCLVWFQKAFQEIIEGKWMRQAVTALPDSDVIYSARSLCSDNTEIIQGEITGIQQWGSILPLALYHLIDLGIPLPAVFYARPAEALASSAATLPSCGKAFTEAALWWLDQNVPQSPAEVIWQLDLAAAALRSETWEDEALCWRLCHSFAQRMENALSTLYRPTLLQEDTVMVLPGMHRFGWYYLEAQKTLETGDELGYIRLLKKGLETAPAMKELVDFLSRQLEKRSAKLSHRRESPELLALAEQIRNILAGYPANDPAVEALKRSPAYQKVAHLIEDAKLAPI